MYVIRERAEDGQNTSLCSLDRPPPTTALNYQPSQSFENIITPHLQHLCRSVMSPCGRGLIKRKSTTTNLLELTSFVNRVLNKCF